MLLTCGVYGAPLVRVVLQQHGRALIDQDLHTLHVTLKRCQTQSRVTLRRPHVQIQQRLDQDLESVVVTVICLEKHTHKQKYQLQFLNVIILFNIQHTVLYTNIIKQTLKSDWMSHVLKH